MAHLRRVSLREVAWRVQEYHRPTGPGTHIFLDKSVKTMHTLHPMAKFRTQSASSDPVSSFRGGSRPAEAPGDGGCREIGNLRRGAHLGGRRSGGRRRRRSAGRSVGRYDGTAVRRRARQFQNACVLFEVVARLWTTIDSRCLEPRNPGRNSPRRSLRKNNQIPPFFYFPPPPPPPE